MRPTRIIEHGNWYQQKRRAGKRELEFYKKETKMMAFNKEETHPECNKTDSSRSNIEISSHIA